MSPKYEPKQNDIAGYIEALTQSEARQINLYKGPDSLRSAIAKERDESGVGSGQEVLQDEVQQPVKSDLQFTPLEMAGGPSDQVADWVSDRLEKAEPFTWRELFAQTDEAFGGTQAQGVYSVKDAYDAMEVGLNRLILKQARLLHPLDPSVEKATNIVKALKAYVNALPTDLRRRCIYT